MESSASKSLGARFRSSTRANRAVSGCDIELNANPGHQDSSLKISRRRDRRSQRRGISSLDYQGLDRIFNANSEQQLLMVLRIMGFYKLQHFLIPAAAQWNKRRGLGEGISFGVEEASLPVWRALTHGIHRHPYGKIEKKNTVYFTDHTGARWDSSTRVAFKIPESTNGSLADVIQELQVLCQPRLYNHPYIVHLLGVAWVRQPKVDVTKSGEEQQWRLEQDRPTIVTEYAPHGSLFEFLRSPTYTLQQVPLRTKILLCMNLLEGMLALHNSGIAHGDITCKNALVYDTLDSSAESWKAKLSDFGNAVVGLDTRTNVPHEMFYTPIYSPPELQEGTGMVVSSLVEKADVWGWGMLLWHVMIDGSLLDEHYWELKGNFYQESQRQVIDSRRLSSLKQSDDLSSVASRSCEAYLSYVHTSGEIPLAKEISMVLKSILVKDPFQRPTIKDLRNDIVKLLDDSRPFPGWTTTNPAPYCDGSSQALSKPMPLAELPFFDFAQHYEIKDFPAVTSRVLQELHRASDSRELGVSLEAHLQLCFCYAAGIDGLVDHKQALGNLWKAASGGLDRAQALILRIHGALGVRLSKEQSNLFIEFSGRPIVYESRIAGAELLSLDSEAYQRLEETRKPDITSKNTGKLTLLEACKTGDLVAAESLIMQERELHVYGPSGETPLHWLGLLANPHSEKLVVLLLAAGLGPHEATMHQTELSAHRRTIPAGTTALHWALEADNDLVLRVLLDFSKENQFPFDMAALLGTAARFQSSQCLVYLCEQLRQEGKGVIFSTI